jgi:hypothetical protein
MIDPASLLESRELQVCQATGKVKALHDARVQKYTDNLAILGSIFRFKERNTTGLAHHKGVQSATARTVGTMA